MRCSTLGRVETNVTAHQPSLPLQKQCCSTLKPTQLTPQSDLSIYTAEMEEDGPRGIVIGDIWYGAEEARAIARFVEEHQEWLDGKGGQ